MRLAGAVLRLPLWAGLVEGVLIDDVEAPTLLPERLVVCCTMGTNYSRKGGKTCEKQTNR